MSRHHLSGCPVDPLSAPSRHQGDDMTASCGRDAASCPVVVPSVSRQTVSWGCDAVVLNEADDDK